MNNIFLVFAIGAFAILMVLTWGESNTFQKISRPWSLFWIVMLALLADQPVIAVTFAFLFSVFLAAPLISWLGPNLTKHHYVVFGFGWLFSSIFVTPPYELFELWVVAIVVVTVILLEASFPEEPLNLQVLTTIVGVAVLVLGLTAWATNQVSPIYVSTIVLLEATIVLMNLRLQQRFMAAVWVILMVGQTILYILPWG